MSDQRRFKRKAVTARRIKNLVLILFALSVIISAIGFTLIRVTIKSIPDYRIAIEKTVSEQLGVDLKIGRLDAEIYWLIPRLNLIDVTISSPVDNSRLIHVDEIDLSLDWINTLQTGIPAINEIILDGLNIQIGVNESSQLIVQDFVLNENVDAVISSATGDTSSQGLTISEEIKSLINNLNFRIINSQIRLFHHRGQLYDKTLKNFNLRLYNDGEQHKFEIKTELPERYGKAAHVIVETYGDIFEFRNLRGKAYLSLKEVNVAPWINDYWRGSALAVNARVNNEIWLEWQDTHIDRVRSTFDISDLAVHYLADSVKSWNLDVLEGRVQWQRKETGWIADIRELRSARNESLPERASAISVVMSELDKELKLEADYARVESLSYLAGMIFSFDEKQVGWLELLEKHKPQGYFRNMDIVLPMERPENIRINTEFSGVGLSLPDNEPLKIENLDGSVIYYAGETWLALESKQVRLSFNKLFRNDITLKLLQGIVSFNYGEGLSVRSGSLLANTEHIETETRLDLRLGKDRPFMDLTTRFRNGNAKYVSRYLPAGIMGADTVAWLDKGIVSGLIKDGAYQFYGYLQDMPFRKAQGVSLAVFNTQDFELDYMPGWPAITGIESHARFENMSMSIAAKTGQIYDSVIQSALIVIDDFSTARLDVDGNVLASLSDIQKYLINSGLRSFIPDYVEKIELAGDGKLDLKLSIPLSTDEVTRWSGKYSTQNGIVDLKPQNYLLSGVAGVVTFNDGYFEIPEMKYRLDGMPMMLDLNTSRSEEGIYRYNFNTSGNISARSLLSPLKEYQHRLTGSTDMSLELNLYSSDKPLDLLMDLNMTSSLQGANVYFPGALYKQEQQSLPVDFRMQMLKSGNVKYDLQLKDRGFISLHEFDQNWLLTTDTESVKGVMDIAKQAEMIDINLDYFDLNQFLITVPESVERSERSLFPRNIPSLKFVSKNLRWRDFTFKNVEMATTQSNAGMDFKSIKLDAEHYQVNGVGYWYSGWSDKHRTGFNVDVTVSDLGEMLSQIDVSNAIKGGSGTVGLNIKWDDSPQNFSWNLLQGKGRLDMADGAIRKIDVGAGKMLGIFSVKTLFSLDFAKQLSSGFPFDKATGNFSFRHGSAYSENFKIESKVADMGISGSLDIPRQQVSQLVKVKPHISSTVTLGSAVVAGPTVGGIVYLFNKIFDPDSLTEYEYRITGTMADPDVKLVSRPVVETETETDEEFADE